MLKGKAKETVCCFWFLKKNAVQSNGDKVKADTELMPIEVLLVDLTS